MKLKFVKGDYVYISRLVDSGSVYKWRKDWMLIKIIDFGSPIQNTYRYKIIRISANKVFGGHYEGDTSYFQHNSGLYREGINTGIKSEIELDAWILAHAL